MVDTRSGQFQEEIWPFVIGNKGGIKGARCGRN